MAAENSSCLWTAVWAVEEVNHEIPIGDSEGSSGEQRLLTVHDSKQSKRQLRPEDS